MTLSQKVYGLAPTGRQGVLPEFAGCALCKRRRLLPVGEASVILLHPPLRLAGVSEETMRECQQNDSVCHRRLGACCGTTLHVSPPSLLRMALG